jgi:PTH1 family peptidyl-tRNA hydrolase
VGVGNPSLVVGLGNPGSRYAFTRHNAGFIVVDALAARWGLGPRDWQRKNEARFVLDRSRNAILVEPQAYMNLSGRPVQGLATFYKVPPERMLVVVDDLDLPFGRLRMRAGGSSGGHNGLKSLIEVLGEGFPRLRIGIGRGYEEHDAIDRVLGDFSEAERKELPSIVDRAVAGVETWLTHGVTQAMNLVNAKE